MVDEAVQLLEHLPRHDERLERWADAAEASLRGLMTDLRKPPELSPIPRDASAP